MVFFFLAIYLTKTVKICLIKLNYTTKTKNKYTTKTKTKTTKQ